jgi:hypothetical protein
MKDTCPKCEIKVKWMHKMCGKDMIRECRVCKHKEHLK